MEVTSEEYSSSGVVPTHTQYLRVVFLHGSEPEDRELDTDTPRTLAQMADAQRARLASIKGPDPAGSYQNSQGSLAASLENAPAAAST